MMSSRIVGAARELVEVGAAALQVCSGVRDDRTSAIEHREVRSPRAHRVAISLGHHTRRLRDVTEVVRHPGGEQLTQGDGAEVRVLALE
jgi:hypothetical protein